MIWDRGSDDRLTERSEPEKKRKRGRHGERIRRRRDGVGDRRYEGIHGVLVLELRGIALVCKFGGDLEAKATVSTFDESMGACVL